LKTVSAEHFAIGSNLPAGRPPPVIDGVRRENQVRSRLPGGGRWIRTLGPPSEGPPWRSSDKRSASVKPQHARSCSVWIAAMMACPTSASTDVGPNGIDQH